MFTQYIYLLQEREFIKTNENIYKVGMTKKENLERFKQYPKGSVLLFQMICNNCRNIENQVINLFKQNFKLRKDIGNEYFEGEYKNMIDIIYSIIKNEKEECENDKLTDEGKHEDVDDPYQITTYEEWIEYNGISKIIITEKKGEGFLRFKGETWRELYDKNRLDFDENYMEDLLGFIEKNQACVMKMIRPNDLLVSYSEMRNAIHNYKNNLTNEIITWEEFNKLNKIEKEYYNHLYKIDEYTFIDVEYNENQIFQDIIKKCLVKSYDFYNLNYHDYIIPKYNGVYKSTEYVVFNSLTFTFTPVDELINNKIITYKDCGESFVFVKNIVNIDFVNDILNSLITPEIKLKYKNLVYNLIVKQEEDQIIFYDYNNCLLTTWIRDLLNTISNTKFYVNSCDYYENKLEFKKLLKTQKPRCVIINNYKDIPIETQVNLFCKFGFRNIIVCQNDKTNNMYNISNFRKYLNDNKELLMKCIKEENNCIPIRSWQYEIQHDDNIFYKSDLLKTNFLKWCCINKS
jgi:hypothetical protein